MFDLWDAIVVSQKTRCTNTRIVDNHGGRAIDAKHKNYKHKIFFCRSTKETSYVNLFNQETKLVLKNFQPPIINFGYFITLVFINIKVKKNVSMSFPLSLFLQTRTTRGSWMQCTIPTIHNWRLNNIQMFVDTHSKKSPLLQVIW